MLPPSANERDEALLPSRSPRSSRWEQPRRSRESAGRRPRRAADRCGVMRAEEIDFVRCRRRLCTSPGHPPKAALRSLRRGGSTDVRSDLVRLSVRRVEDVGVPPDGVATAVPGSPGEERPREASSGRISKGYAANSSTATGSGTRRRSTLDSPSATWRDVDAIGNRYCARLATGRCGNGFVPFIASEPEE